MTKSPYLRASLVQATLEHVPPLIRQSLLEQRSFREEFGLGIDAVVKFDDLDISIQRSELFQAIRDVLDDRPGVAVTDTDGKNWTISAESEKGEQPRILIADDDQRYILPDFTALSPNSATRLRSLEKAASNVNLPEQATTAWHDTLSERSLEDEEVDQFLSEFRDTPVQAARLIRTEFQEGQSSVSSLVSASRRYYARLVGEYDESTSISDYAARTGSEFIKGLLERLPYEGFLASLLLSSHSLLTAEISIEQLKDEDIARAFEFLIERGDRLSQMGAIEVGLRVLPERPEIEPLLVRLVEQIRNDDVNNTSSQFKLLSALFILVDGELSRIRCFSDAPPFYRRLASLAQASLIQREAVAATVEPAHLYEWALSNRIEQFYLQSLADMRLEPHWKPDFADASHMKADFCGRLVSAGKTFEKNITTNELRLLLLGSESDNILSKTEPLFAFLPGPLEGSEVNPNVLPEHMSEELRATMEAENIGSSSLIELIAKSWLYRVDESYAEMASVAVQRAKHQIKDIENRSQLIAILRGLADIAAVSRGQPLADELRILVRRYRRDKQHALTIEEALNICLVASASRSGLKDWLDCVGDWLTELAFEDFQNNEGELFYSRLQRLCHAVPELWVSCGKADAALAAYSAL